MIRAVDFEYLTDPEETASVFITHPDVDDVRGGHDSVERAETNSSDRLEMLPIPRHDAESSLQSRCCNQCIRKPRARLPSNPSCSFRNGSVDIDFTEWCQQPDAEIGCRVAGKQLGSRHDRIVHSMFPRAELTRSAQVVDENVGVDEQVSHGTMRCVKEPPRRERLRTWLRGPPRDRACRRGTHRQHVESPAPSRGLRPQRRDRSSPAAHR